jgi:ABC-type phosphate/phosphonate transport system ATPase subunit
MVKLIIGIKGTGKTKTLIKMVDEALEKTTGDVVVLEKGEKLKFDIKYQARLVNTEEYYINDAQSLYGFVAGILASNHDVTDLFIDTTLRICANDVAAFEKMVEEIDILTVKKDVNIVMTASIDENEASDVIKKYV